MVHAESTAIEEVADDAATRRLTVLHHGGRSIDLDLPPVIAQGQLAAPSPVAISTTSRRSSVQRLVPCRSRDRPRSFDFGALARARTDQSQHRCLRARSPRFFHIRAFSPIWF